MSSATSIDGVSTAVAKGNPAAEGRTHQADSFRPWHFFVLASLLAATAAVIMARQSRPEHLVLISLTIGAAGFAAAALYRTLVPLVSPETVEAAGPLAASTRAILEREKMLALRAIKDLEFDRAMGKLSAKDFDEMAGRLRARAITLMKQLDAGEGSAYRELIERELSLRTRTSRSAKAPRGEKHVPRGQGATPPAPAAPVRVVCACGTANDPDASFCKKCGARLTHETVR
jgi:hypothetical protein